MTKGQRGKQVPILLGEIKQEGIDIQKIITENGLDGEFEYGKNIKKLKSCYMGYGSCEMTEEEKEEVRKLGLISEETRSIVTQTLEIVRVLKANGVDLSKVQLTKTQNGKSVSILLKEIEQEGIDIEKIIEQNGLDGNFAYGKNVASLRQAYTGVQRYRITEQEKEEAIQLGLIRTLRGQDIGKASFDAPVEKCDEAQAVLDRLVEREQEGEIGKNE